MPLRLDDLGPDPATSRSSCFICSPRISFRPAEGEADRCSLVAVGELDPALDGLHQCSRLVGCPSGSSPDLPASICRFISATSSSMGLWSSPSKPAMRAYSVSLLSMGYAYW